MRKIKDINTIKRKYNTKPLITVLIITSAMLQCLTITAGYLKRRDKVLTLLSPLFCILESTMV